jgi:hypothetical protein
MSPVHLASVIDVDDVETTEFVVDAVDDPITPAASGTKSRQLATQRTPQSVRLLGQRTEDERQTRCADLLREPKKVTLSPGGAPHLVRRTH